MRLCVIPFGVVALLLSGWGCSTPPPWELPPQLQNGSRVRVVAPRLGPALIPGRVQLSSDGCWVVEAAVTNDPDAITLLTPRELERVQLSKAIPPPDWWAVPEDDEGWEDLLPSVLEQGVAPKCKRRQEQGATVSVERDGGRLTPR
jgi:hypothetical protein